MLDSLFKSQYQHNVQIGTMFHDLFPLLIPEMCDQITVDGYTPWFKRIVPRSDFFIANSQATLNTFKKYINEHPELRPHRFGSGSFRLGAELDRAHIAQKSTTNTQPIWDTEGKTLLTIGTLEPRKNHTYLLDAFDLLRQRNEMVSLILIGAKGWKTSDLLERVKSHPDFGKHLLYFDGATDYELDQAIQRADFLICPSLAEGFGLPVVEALMKGLTVFASDIPPFREIGDGYCHFFDLNSPEDLANQLQNAIHHPEQFQNHHTAFSWPNWEQSAHEFIELTMRLSGIKQEAKITTEEQIKELEETV
jgi:alpha-1,2-rhamnosyltransferase